jgi:ATP-binding cassette subfamily B protein
MWERMKNQSIIFIAHRFSTIRHADHILVLEHGKKVEEGNHSELMQRNGVYAKMFTLQIQMYREAEQIEESKTLGMTKGDA